MAQESETKQQARPHLRPVPLEGEDAGPEAAGSIPRHADEANGMVQGEPGMAEVTAEVDAGADAAIGEPGEVTTTGGVAPVSEPTGAVSQSADGGSDRRG